LKIVFFEWATVPFEVAALKRGVEGEKWFRMNSNERIYNKYQISVLFN